MRSKVFPLLLCFLFSLSACVNPEDVNSEIVLSPETDVPVKVDPSYTIDHILLDRIDIEHPIFSNLPKAEELNSFIRNSIWSSCVISYLQEYPGYTEADVVCEVKCLVSSVTSQLISIAFYGENGLVNSRSFPFFEAMNIEIENLVLLPIQNFFDIELLANAIQKHGTLMTFDGEKPDAGLRMLFRQEIKEASAEALKKDLEHYETSNFFFTDRSIVVSLSVPAAYYLLAEVPLSLLEDKRFSI